MNAMDSPAGPPPAPAPITRLRLYNTPDRTTEDFVPLRPGRAGMYTCGPTVYAAQHIGNLRSQLFADLLRRALWASGLEVDHVINITDVGHLTDDASDGEDKVEVAARSAGKRASEIARHYEAQWSRDRARLGCLPPTVLCRATEHISEQVQLIERIEQNGYTYLTPDGLYFDTSRFERYADFAHLSLDAQSTTGRVRQTDDKRHPADFALWKFSSTGVRRQQEWPSPWGVGFPGWHIECTAMAIRYLGPQFDLHTGGIDHIGVHHTNEIAQAESALGVHPWVRYWLHAAFLNMKGAKLSKSSGPTVLLDDLVERGISARAYRYFFLTAHYRAPQELSWDALEAAERSLVRLRRLSLPDAGHEAGLDPAIATAGERFRGSFWDAVADDLNAPRALAVAWETATASTLDRRTRAALLAEFDLVLGLGLGAKVETADAGRPVIAESTRAWIESLIEERAQARTAGRFAAADQIRSELESAGIGLTDAPDGTTWYQIV